MCVHVHQINNLKRQEGCPPPPRHLQSPRPAAEGFFPGLAAAWRIAQDAVLFLAQAPDKVPNTCPQHCLSRAQGTSCRGDQNRGEPASTFRSPGATDRAGTNERGPEPPAGTPFSPRTPCPWGCRGGDRACSRREAETSRLAGLREGQGGVTAGQGASPTRMLCHFALDARASPGGPQEVHSKFCSRVCQRAQNVPGHQGPSACGCASPGR